MNKKNDPTPENILKTSTAFWASKVWLSAVHFQVFTLTDWAKQAGFKSTAIIPLAGPVSACIAYK
jgi:hypothetical protein